MPLSGEPDRWRFQQKQAADRGLSSLVPRGKVQEGEAPSWFPAPAPERIRIIFPGDTRGGKNSSHGATCRGRLSGPGAKAERYRHRRNAGAGSGKWLRHFHETPHGATCRDRPGGPGAQAQCHRHRRNAGADSWKWLRHFHETLHGAKCGRKAAPERSDWPSSQRPGGAETGPSRWRKSPWRF